MRDPRGVPILHSSSAAAKKKLLGLPVEHTFNPMQETFGLSMEYLNRLQISLPLVQKVFVRNVSFQNFQSNIKFLRWFFATFSS